MGNQAPPLNGILETSLYVEDPGRGMRFYRDVLGFRVLIETERLVALDAGKASVLLLFPKADLPDVRDAGGLVPGHGGAGQLHVAFAVAEADLPSWRERLANLGIALIGEYHWPRGGTSLYVNDPDGHVVELATPGLWPIY